MGTYYTKKPRHMGCKTRRLKSGRYSGIKCGTRTKGNSITVYEWKHVTCKKCLATKGK